MKQVLEGHGMCAFHRCIVHVMDKKTLLTFFLVFLSPALLLAEAAVDDLMPDLTARVAISGKLWPGRKIGRKLKITLRNRGDGYTEDVPVKVVLSKHRMPKEGSKEYFLTKTVVPRLPVDRPTKVLLDDSLKLPEKLAYGRYIIRVTLDEDNQIKERNEKNNVAFRPIRIVPPPPDKPDLVARIRLLSQEVLKPGTKLQNLLEIDIRNIGKVATTAPFALDVVLSKSERVDYDRIPAIYRPDYKDDCLLKGGREVIRKLAPGKWQRVKLRGSLEIPVMRRWPPYFVGVVIDSSDAIKEENEANNTAFYPIKIPGQKKVRP